LLPLTPNDRKRLLNMLQRDELDAEFKCVHSTLN
jgi:hypothetical protein